MWLRLSLGTSFLSLKQKLGCVIENLVSPYIDVHEKVGLFPRFNPKLVRSFWLLIFGFESRQGVFLVVAYNVIVHVNENILRVGSHNIPSHMRSIHPISTVESMEVGTYHFTHGFPSPKSQLLHGCLHGNIFWR